MIEATVGRNIDDQSVLLGQFQTKATFDGKRGLRRRLPLQFGEDRRKDSLHMIRAAE